MKQPNSRVLQAFGVKTQPILLKGGQGETYKAGNIVLKPVSNIEEANWVANLFSSIKSDEFRVERPIKDASGKWVFDGWSAFAFVEGKEKKSKWKEKIQVSRLFHKQLSSVKKPSFIDNQNHPWAISDRMIWSEEPLEYSSRLAEVLDPLRRILKPLNLACQLIHADMGGNILFSDELPPAVIDMSPYWRPREYPTAIIIVDSIAWENAPDSLLAEMDNTNDMNQFLVRALM